MRRTLSYQDQGGARFRRCLGLAAIGVASGAAACRPKATPLPSSEPPAPAVMASATSAVIPAPSSTAAEEAPVPVLSFEPFVADKAPADGVFGIEGGVVVSRGTRVGRVVGDRVEWLPGAIPRRTEGIGDNFIERVMGAWPDRVAVLYETNNSRAAIPTYLPLSGKNRTLVIGEGGSTGWVTGVATAGETTIVGAYEIASGVRFVTVGGPRVILKQLTPAQAGCKPDEVTAVEGFPARPAITPSLFGATRAGTWISIGDLCEKRPPAAEVWDASGKSHVVDLAAFAKGVGHPSAILQGQGDEAWIHLGSGAPILHYQAGQITALPKVDAEVAFLSPDGKLFAADERAVHRLDGERWTLVARIAWRPHFLGNMAVEGETFWATLGPWAARTAYRLRPGPDPAFKESCTTPFVYLYDVNLDNAKTFTFPATRKALSTFAEHDDLGLVEFVEAGSRRLGITVKSKAQGEAVIAHVKATMKDESPTLLCYAPSSPRRIDLQAGR